MFGGKIRQENAKNGIYERLDFEIFWTEHDPQTSLKARAFGASQLPQLSEKSGNCPVRNLTLGEEITCA